MGHTKPILMQFDLACILHPIDGLEDLTRPFETKKWML
jgi:hypothetical protein